MKENLTERYTKRLYNECIDECDTEVAHMKADNILCALLYELGYDEVVKEYDKVSKWFA